MKRKTKSLKRRRFIQNTIVHVFLGILGFIWVLPIFFVILTSFRAEGGSYELYIPKRIYTK